MIYDDIILTLNSLSGLEVITSLCSIADNHTHLIDNLGAEQYQLICQLLLVPDVQLLHSALESMYSLTSLGMLFPNTLLL